MQGYRYEVTVLKDSTPRVVEEDIKIACERLGYEVQVDEEAEGSFGITSDHPLNQRAVRQDIEALDGASRCKVAIECLQRP